MEKELNKNGYIILKGWLTDIPGVDGIKVEPIFNDNPSYRTDKKRKQATLQPSQYKWVKEIHRRLSTEWPLLRPSSASFLVSEPGCQRQAAHCDYIPSPELLSADPHPLLVLIAIEPNTTLDIWPGSHLVIAEKKKQLCKRQVVSLDPGDALIFRADLVHAGSAYSVRNNRIHYYLDSPILNRAPNRTWIIYKHAAPEIRELIDES